MKKITTKNPWLPPRGIRYKDRPDRPTPYYLIWTEADEADREGKPKERSLSYDTADAREIAARALADKLKKTGDVVLDFDPDEWRRYQDFRSLIGVGVDPILVAHEWLASKQGKPLATGLKVSEAFEKYLVLRDGEKSWGVDSRRHAKKHLERFCRVFGERRLYEVSTDEVRAWLSDLKDDDGKTIGPYGKKDHRKNVNTFFTYAIREKWGARENPVAVIKPPKTDDGDPVVITVRDAFEYFKCNRDERLVGRVAMEAFGGIRYTTAGKIQKAGIFLQTRGIRMAANIHKSGLKDGRARFRQGQPDNLWAWLNHAPETCWEMTPLNYREAKRYAWIRAELRPSELLTDADKAKSEALDNTWRHSFISYHLARYKSVPLAQYLAQHQSSRQTQEYEGLADETDAARFFMITPASVQLTWEQFMALPIPAMRQMDSVAVAAVTAVG